MSVEVCSLFEPLNPHKIFILEKRIKKKIRIHRQPIESFIKRRTVKSDMKSLKYSQFEPLYELWCDYFSTLVNGSNGQLDARMLKADYHGCLLMIVEAANPAQVGICGIVTRETRQTFMLITKQDRFYSKARYYISICTGRQNISFVRECVQISTIIASKKDIEESLFNSLLSKIAESC
uniref:Ribonuclease P protein subunit p29 n=1 Tax=Wuchereria bancrofti TaxID=6293 RepID=A0A1I8ETY5_WUCBA